MKPFGERAQRNRFGWRLSTHAAWNDPPLKGDPPRPASIGSPASVIWLNGVKAAPSNLRTPWTLLPGLPPSWSSASPAGLLSMATSPAAGSTVGPAQLAGSFRPPAPLNTWNVVSSPSERTNTGVVPSWVPIAASVGTVNPASRSALVVAGAPLSELCWTLVVLAMSSDSPGPAATSKPRSWFPTLRGGPKLRPPSADSITLVPSPGPQQRTDAIRIRLPPGANTWVLWPTASSGGVSVFVLVHPFAVRGIWQ